MRGKIVVFFLLFFLFVTPVQALRSLPSGVQPEPVSGEAVGTFSFLGSFSGIGSLTFINTGGKAHLKTICDMSTVNMAAGERCEGVDLEGTFSGGPDGVAVFPTENGGEIKLNLDDGKIFLLTTQGITMKFTVSNPTVFDDWKEVGNNLAEQESGKNQEKVTRSLPNVRFVMVGGIVVLALIIMTGVLFQRKAGFIKAAK